MNGFGAKETIDRLEMEADAFYTEYGITETVDNRITSDEFVALVEPYHKRMQEEVKILVDQVPEELQENARYLGTSMVEEFTSNFQKAIRLDVYQTMSDLITAAEDIEPGDYKAVINLTPEEIATKLLRDERIEEKLESFKRTGVAFVKKEIIKMIIGSMPFNPFDMLRAMTPPCMSGEDAEE